MKKIFKKKCNCIIEPKQEPEKIILTKDELMYYIEEKKNDLCIYYSSIN